MTMLLSYCENSTFKKYKVGSECILIIYNTKNLMMFLLINPEEFLSFWSFTLGWWNCINYMIVTCIDPQPIRALQKTLTWLNYQSCEHLETFHEVRLKWDMLHPPITLYRISSDLKWMAGCVVHISIYRTIVIVYLKPLFFFG